MRFHCLWGNSKLGAQRSGKKIVSKCHFSVLVTQARIYVTLSIGPFSKAQTDSWHLFNKSHTVFHSFKNRKTAGSSGSRFLSIVNSASILYIWIAVISANWGFLIYYLLGHIIPFFFSNNLLSQINTVVGPYHLLSVKPQYSPKTN